MHPDIYFAGVAAGLTHIHGKGILHNHIKADNIALGDCLPTSEIPVAQFWPTIIDFGKACPSEMGKKYVLDHYQKEVYRNRYSHIAPDLVDGIYSAPELSLRCFRFRTSYQENGHGTHGTPATSN